MVSYPVIPRGLLPESMLRILREEAAKQFDSQLYWLAQVLDADGNPETDLYGAPSWQEPQILPCRIVQCNETFYNYQGVQVVVSQRIYLPPFVGVQAGDKLLLSVQDPTDPAARFPPILHVGHVPSEGTVLYDLVLTGPAE